MLSAKNTWTQILTAAILAVTLAAMGLALTALSPGTSSLVTSALLLGSLAATAVAFASLTRRLRRLELENEGLIEDISQEFDRVKDRLALFDAALQEPRSLSPDGLEDAPMRRVMVK